MQRLRDALCSLWLVAVFTVAGAFAQTGPAPGSAIRTSGFTLVETLAVDATEAPRKVFHARLTIPATPGDFVLLYPKWIPGEHGPSGPLVDTAGIYFRVHQDTNQGRALAWHRDPVDMFAFHIDVPEGVTSIDAALDFLAPVEGGGFSAGASSSDKLAVLSWNWLVLYPKGLGSDDIGVQASLKMPSDWQWASALPAAGAGSGNAALPASGAVGEAQFALASLTTLIDSPVLMGEYMKKVPLQRGQAPSHELDIVADSEAALAMQPEQVKAFDNLVAEAGSLYGARHYREYHFLLTLSNHVAHFGLEHHECNDSRVSENYLTDENQWTLEAGLLPHEYTHSWNGKYRRPAGLATPDYESPMEGNLLWVYEGLTQYFGSVLTARSGLMTPQQMRDQLARVAMTYSHRPGRLWRPLEDTATAAQFLYGAPYAFSNYRRAPDFYDEGLLIWLEADTILRRKSGGAKSMDDFAHLFYGGRNTPPEVKTYTFDDVVDTLNQVQPYDWRAFLTDRVRKISEHAPLEGLANAGWKLVYNEKPNAISRMHQEEGAAYDASASLGLVISKEGAVLDAIEDGLAAKKGIGPGMKIVAVNDRKYGQEFLLAAMREAHTSHQPIRLLMENAEYIRPVSLDYFDGPLNPHLVRDETKPDLLDEIFRPKVTTLPKPFTSED
jgi:predicted metalloprotease with PDZ domain